jgi:hypothetical protein
VQLTYLDMIMLGSAAPTIGPPAIAIAKLRAQKNPKSECRNPKQIRNSKKKTRKQRW